MICSSFSEVRNFLTSLARRRDISESETKEGRMNDILMMS